MAQQRRSMDKGHGNELLCQRTGVLLAEVRRCTQGSSSSAARHQAPRVGARLGAGELRRPKPELAAAEAELACGQVPCSPRPREACGSPGGARCSHASSSPRRRLLWAWRGARGSHGPSTSGSRRWPGVELLAPWVKLIAGDVGHRTPPCALLPVPLRAAPSSAAAPLLLAPCSACALVEMRHTSLLLRATCHRNAAASVGDGESSWAAANEAIPIPLHCFQLFVFNVANVCFICFERSRAMSKTFHVDVAK
jgi:hypothetical protein